MRGAPRHWTTLARGVANRLAGLDKPGRVARVREEARELGLEAHTLRRYLVLAAFLDRLGVREADAGRLPIGALEVILRIWNHDPSVAANALRMVRDGGLSFRKALALEKSLKARRSVHLEPAEPSWDLSDWLRKRVAEAVGSRADDLLERGQVDDPRFDLVQVQRLYVSGDRTIALLDEATYAEIAETTFVARLVRDVLIAAALYDDVVVSLAFSRSEDGFAKYIRMARPERSACVRLLDMGRENAVFEYLED